MDTKSLFARHEYEIGTGVYDTSGLFGPVHFDKAEYHTQLFVSYVSVFMSILMTILLVSICCEPVPLWLKIELFVLQLMLAYLATREPFQVVRDFRKRLKKVPTHIKFNAKIVYGKDWREPAIECYEAHIGGDCPLCGAE